MRDEFSASSFCVEHIIPRAAGGSAKLENLAIVLSLASARPVIKLPDKFRLKLRSFVRIGCSFSLLKQPAQTGIAWATCRFRLLWKHGFFPGLACFSHFLNHVQN